MKRLSLSNSLSRLKKCLFILTIFFCNSCTSQKNIIDKIQKDLIYFEFLDKEIKSNSQSGTINYEGNSFKISYNSSKIIFNNNGTILQTYDWEKYGSGFIKKSYNFSRGKDTMRIVCKCGQNRNYFFQNLKFKKGNYELIFNFPKKYNNLKKVYEEDIPYLFGKNIKYSKELQALSFKETKNMKRKIKFENIKFIRLNLNDSINVKLKPQCRVGKGELHP